MDLLLTMLALALAIVISFVPLDAGLLHLLQILLVVFLVSLLALKFFQSQRSKPAATPAPKQEPAAAPAAVAPAPEALVEAGVVQFLARLQEKGRLVDFLMDDVTPYSNEQVGVAARVVHQGCREVLRGTFDIEPLHSGQERDAISLAGDYDAATYRLVGKVPDRPPYQGTVLHRGWKATRISLPRVADSAAQSAARKIIAPAEVEMG
ncbi:DUF2760 domain-containing protein [Geomonas sp. RF6]|uniref:DUF2760 domain-containing protein n=1 Tax=Geomonas sp. RF6 TaxID=2897342 RepID=UPI001E3EFF87|nr:DUF2760 domain-containing protein [Geomonas sp. RF6]UFS70234.1 DUF2760 domain-containing protein [Geomonas sp. RF6]